MPVKDSNGKVLLIALDGLSFDECQYLMEKHNFFAAGAKSNLSTFTGGLLTSAQAIWAEVLSGERWYATGCAGYAFPKESLNDLAISQESSFLFHATIADTPRTITVNVPLVEPGKRMWLSDGTFGNEIVSPSELLQSEPFASYSPRPFAATAYSLANPIQGALQCIAAETQRLKCALALAQANWQTCIVRISVFDLLSHLLGHNYLADTHLVIADELSQFLSYLNTCIGQLVSLSGGANVFVVSTYSHQECKKRVNLNMLLSEHGLLKLKPRSAVEQSLNLRYQASRLVSQRHNSQYVSSPLVSLSNQFEESHTIAASPIHGAIYLNSKDRFAKGIIEKSKAKETAEKIVNCLNQSFNDRGINNICYELNDGQNKLAPDLIVYAKGIDFHDTYDAPWVDSFGKPISCHTPTGFVYAPNRIMTKSITSLQLHTLLTETP